MSEFIHTGIIVPAFWDNTRSLSLAVRALAAYLITGRHNQGIPGLAVIGWPALADSLDITPERLTELWTDLQVGKPGFAEYDGVRRILRVPDVPRMGHRPNHRVLAVWWRAWNMIPHSPLKVAHVESLRQCLPSEAAPLVKGVWDKTFGSVDLQANLPVPLPVNSTVDLTGSLTGSGTGSGTGSLTGPSRSRSQSLNLSFTPDPDPDTALVSTPRVRARSQGGDMGRVVAAWTQYYQERTGCDPVWTDDTRGKVFGSLARLVKAAGAEEVIRRIGVLFDAPPRFLAGSVPDVMTLVQHFEKLAAPYVEPRPVIRTRSGDEGWTPSEMAAEAMRLMELEKKAGTR